MMENKKNPSPNACRGHGTWYTLHLAAYNVKTKDDRKHMVWLLNIMFAQYHCIECRNHIKEYVTKFPYANLKPEIGDDKRDLSYFKYLWKFHNVVNVRLNKKIIHWDEALILYSPTNVCDSGCSEDVTELPSVSFTENVPETTSSTIKFVGR